MSVRTWCKRITERFHAASSRTGRANSVDALGRRLRRKFILVAMGAVTVVLTLIIAGINIVNYSHVCKTADARLDYILAGKDGIDWGDEPKADSANGKEAGDSQAGVHIRHFEGMTAESPFDTRYFTVTIAGGQVADVNTARIAAVGAKRAAALPRGCIPRAGPRAFLVTTAIRLQLKTKRPPLCLWTVRASFRVFIRF